MPRKFTVESYEDSPSEFTVTKEEKEEVAKETHAERMMKMDKNVEDLKKLKFLRERLIGKEKPLGNRK